MSNRPRGAERAALYLRVSLDKTGEGLAVDRQRVECEALARQRGVEIVHTFTDNSVSAAGKRRRPQFQALLDAIERGEVDVVIAWDLTRLTRNPRDRYDLVSLCQAHGVAILLVRGSEMDPRHVHGRIALAVMGELAEEEIKLKGDRQSLAMAQAAEMGKAPQALRAFGWTQDRGELVQPEADAIAAAYRDVLRGTSLAEVARRWNAAGLYSARHRATQSPRWSAETVKALLVNPRNAAIRAVRVPGQSLRWREVGPAQWPRIVDEETYRAVHTLLTDPGRRGAPPAAQRLLSGIAACGVCGAGMLAGRTTANRPTYRCASRGHVSRTSAVVDEFVTDLIVGRLSAPDARDLLDDRGRPDVDELRDERRALTVRLEKLAAEFAEDPELSPGEYRAMRRPLADRIAEITAEIADAGRVDVLGDLVAAEDVRALWDDPAFGRGRQRAVVATLLDIVLHPPGRGARHFDPATVETTWKIT